MQDIGNLAIEVDRITRCPYTPCLKKLHDELRHVSILDLQRWARGNECQLESLADAVIEGLERWQYSLDCLTRLCAIQKFRDIVLQKQPLLLNALLQKATDSDIGFEKYSAVCTSLLSSPLQGALPSAFPAFLERSLARAASTLSADAIRPIHRLLVAVGTDCIRCVSLDLLVKLQDKMLGVLRVLELDDHLAILLCLALLAKLTELAASPALEGPNVRTFLQPSGHPLTAKAQKTLTLVLLKAIYVCSNSDTSPLQDRVESLQLSANIINTIQESERQSWYAANQAKARKLLDKITRPDLDKDVQTLALDLYCSLLDNPPMAADVISTFKGCILDSRFNFMRPVTIRKVLPHLDEDSLRKIMQASVSLTCRMKPRTPKTLDEIDHVRHFVDVISNHTAITPSLSKSVMPDRPDAEITERLREFATTGPFSHPVQTDHPRGDCCLRVFVKALNRLREELRKLLFKCALRLPRRQEGGYIEFLDLLIESRPWSGSIVTACQCTNPPRRVPDVDPSLFEAQGTPPDVHSISHNWKEALRKQMSSDADLRINHVVRIVGDVCRDLESRCHDVERPLREQQTKCDGLQARLSALEAHAQRLAEEFSSSNSTRIALETKYEDLLSDFQSVEARLQGTTQDLKERDAEIERLVITLRETSDAATKSTREQDLANLATVKAKDEMYDQQTREVERAQKRISELLEQIIENQEQRSESLQALEQRDLTIRGLQQEVAESDSSLILQQKENQSLKGVLDAQKTEKEKLATAGKLEIAQLTATIAGLESQLQSAKEARDRTQMALESLKESTDVEQSNMKLSYDKAISGLHAQLSTMETYKLDLEKEAATEISHLNDDAARLRQDLMTKAKGLEEARDWRRKIMILVGKDFPLPSRTPKRDRRRSGLSNGGDPADRQSFDSSAISFCSDPSSPSGASTTKRNKYKLTESPKLTRKRHEGLTKGHTKRSPLQAVRQPLLETCTRHNRRSTTAGLRQHVKQVLAPVDVSSGMLTKATENQAPYAEGESFEAGDPFTSNDQRHLLPSAAPWTGPSGFIDEGKTTAEF